MPHALIISGGSQTLSDSTTYYFVPCTGGLVWRSDEASAQRTYRTAGTLSNLSVRIVSTDLTSSTARLRKNGANGTQTMTMSGTGKFEDTTHTDSVVAGDQIDYRIVAGNPPNGSVGVVVSIISMVFNSDRLTSTFANVPAGDALTTTVQYSALGTYGATTNIVQANGQNSSRATGTVKNFFTYISANVVNPGSSMLFTVDAGGDTLTITIPGGQTGIFENTTIRESVNAGDLVGYITQISP